jgi:hypothetical protein
LSSRIFITPITLARMIESGWITSWQNTSTSSGSPSSQ